MQLDVTFAMREVREGVGSVVKTRSTSAKVCSCARFFGRARKQRPSARWGRRSTGNRGAGVVFSSIIVVEIRNLMTRGKSLEI